MISSAEWTSQDRLVCGIMTGTSLDGIDVALVRFSNKSGRLEYKQLDYKTVPFSGILHDTLVCILDGQPHISLVSEVNHMLSREFALAAIKVCGRNFKSLDAIGTHGQTVWHQPPGSKEMCPSTLQLGSGPALAALTDKIVVSDFRTADMALGGQGAPLVPIFDYEFMRSSNKNIIALNIGGISNITYLPKKCAMDQVVAFDTGPGNCLLDQVMQEHFGRPFDKDGYTAKLGDISRILVSELMKTDIISARPPKSTGREVFNLNMVNKILLRLGLVLKPRDLLASLTEFTAESISYNIHHFARKPDIIYVSGGGVHNLFLINLLRDKMPGVKILSTREAGLDPDSKEAVCFSYLTYRTLAGLHGNLPSVTGAIKRSVLGAVSFP